MGPKDTRQGRRDSTLGTAVTGHEKASVVAAMLREGATDPGPMIRQILFAYRDSAEVRDAVRKHRLFQLQKAA